MAPFTMSEIKAATSAYHLYMKEKHAEVKASLEVSGGVIINGSFPRCCAAEQVLDCVLDKFSSVFLANRYGSVQELVVGGGQLLCSMLGALARTGQFEQIFCSDFCCSTGWSCGSRSWIFWYVDVVYCLGVTPLTRFST